jgi:ammonia channel protein AmtB
VHAWNGVWGVIAVGMFASPDLITNSYGTSVFDGSQRPYGFVFSGSDGHLLVTQIAYALFISRALPTSPSHGKVRV